MKRGEVYYLRSDNGIGFEESIGRPVCIVTSQKGIDTSAVLQVVSLTTATKRCGINVLVNTPKRKSWVLTNQIQTIDRERLLEEDCRYQLTEREMLEVDKKLKIALGLTDEDSEEPVVEEPVEEKADDTELRVELEMYKRLYEKAVEKLVDVKFKKDTSVAEIVVEPPKVTEEQVSKLMDKLAKTACVTRHNLRAPNGVNKSTPPEELKKYASSTGKANINTGLWYVIAATTGMGVQTAQRIVAYRNKNGRYGCIEDLLKTGRFVTKNLEKYRDKLEV